MPTTADMPLKCLSPQNSCCIRKEHKEIKLNTLLLKTRDKKEYPVVSLTSSQAMPAVGNSVIFCEIHDISFSYYLIYFFPLFVLLVLDNKWFGFQMRENTK